MAQRIAKERSINVDYFFWLKTILGHLLIKNLSDEIKEALCKLVSVLLLLDCKRCTLHKLDDLGDVRIFLQKTNHFHFLITVLENRF